MNELYITRCRYISNLAVMVDDQDGNQHAIIVFREDGTFVRPPIPSAAALGIKVNKFGQIDEHNRK